MDEMVASIFGDKKYLDSRKQLNFQRTRNQDKIVIPNIHPFNAINMIAQKSLADDSKSTGFHFYETTKGFHFRSFESLMVTSNLQVRPVKQIFRYVPQNMGEEGEEKLPEDTNKIIHDLQSVESVEYNNGYIWT